MTSKSDNMSDMPSSSGTAIGAHIGNDNYGSINIHHEIRHSAEKKPPASLHKFPPCNNFFSGREDILRQIEEAIVFCEEGQTSLERMFAIIGFGGMGKSEIAKQLAKKLQSKYDFIFWFDAETKTSLDSDFRQLAALLRIPVKAEHGPGLLSSVYISLSQNYKNGIFILDNAEHLKAEEGHFGIEEYLMLDLQCKKPVFLITSRNPWGSARDKIRCIQLDRLSDEDSQKCLLKYMGLENQPLPGSLQATTISLAQSLEGYPLLLSLIALGFADKAEKISLDTIESRLLSCTKFLQDQSLLKASGESNHEKRLQIIFNSTVQKVEATTHGKISVELLNIIALLPPDRIYAGLVNGIYGGKPFKPNTTLCPRFVWDDLETCVSAGLNILLRNSLIKIERRTYKGDFGQVFEYDMIKVHRLIQKSIQNWDVSADESVVPLEKIMRHHEHSGLNLDNIQFLVNVCKQNHLCQLETCYLVVILAELSLEFNRNSESFQKVRELLRAKELDPDSDKMLSVLEGVHVLMGPDAPGTHSYPSALWRDDWSEVKRFLMELSSGFANQRWVINLALTVIGHFPTPFLQGENNADFCGWFLKRYEECKEGVWFEDRVFYLFLDYHDWSEDPELISRIFHNMREHRWDEFWRYLHKIIKRCNVEQRIKLLEPLLNHSEADIFSLSLQFRQHSTEIRSNERFWFSQEFYPCIMEVARIPELRKILVKKRILDSFWDHTSFILKQEPYKCNDWPESFRGVILTWCFLFHHDVAVYECFGRILDSEMEDWHGRNRGWNTRSWVFYGDYENYPREFADAKHCSKATRTWILELLKPENQFWKWIRGISKKK